MQDKYDQPYSDRQRRQLVITERPAPNLQSASRPRLGRDFRYM